MQKRTTAAKQKRATAPKPIVSEVVSRVLSESVLTISQARAEIGNISGDRPDKSTMIRWITRGANGVRLDGCKVSRDWVTSTEALNRFIVARTQQAMSH
jgi:hypothetical protein